MLANTLYRLYRPRRPLLQAVILQAVSRLEGGMLYSTTMRRIFRDYHQVDIGLYTHGDCFTPGAFDRHTTVGRYCSIAQGVRVMNRNHPLEFKSTHAFFFNPMLGHCDRDPVDYMPLEIGSDVWIGTNALVLPHVRRIGDGAVVAAGAVLNKDVPPYAIVVGNPARVVRFRFSQSIIDQLLAERWWEKSVEELELSQFGKPLVSATDLHLNPECMRAS